MNDTVPTEPEGFHVTYAQDPEWGGWHADLRDVLGRVTHSGNGPTREAARMHLLERVERDEALTSKTIEAGKGVTPMMGELAAKLARPAAPPRPYYLAAPCPPWCASEHGIAEWAYDDRRHGSVNYDVTLTVMDAIVWQDRGEVKRDARLMSASLDQHYREAQPRVCIARGDEPAAVAYLTLDEAEAHARHLLELVRAARDGAA